LNINTVWASAQYRNLTHWQSPTFPCYFGKSGFANRINGETFKITSIWDRAHV